MSDAGVDVKPICHINLSHEFRGAERQTEILIRGIAQWNLAQRLVVLDGDAMAKNLADTEGLQIVTVPETVGAAAKAAKGCRFVHAHNKMGLAAAQRARFFYKIPFLYTRRDTVAPAKSWFTRRAYRKAGAVVAISNAVKKSLLSFDPALKPIVIHSCANVIKSFSATSEALQTRYADKFVIGHVGVLDDAKKGQLDLIDVAKSMSRTHPDIVFLFVGSGPDEARLKDAARNLSNIEFTGSVQNLGDYLKVMSAFAFPSREEGLGAALLDAMDYSLPVIASATGGIPEIIQDGKNGLLVNAGNTDQLAFAIQRLYNDEALRTRLGQSGHERVQKFTPDAMVERYLEVYQKTMA